MISKILCKREIHKWEIFWKHHYIHSFETNGYIEIRHNKLVSDGSWYRCKWCGKEIPFEEIKKYSRLGIIL